MTRSSLRAPPSSDLCPDVAQTFFWDKLPQGRVAGTFWATHPPDYSLLSSSIPEAEELFQVPSTGCSSCALNSTQQCSSNKPVLPLCRVAVAHLPVHDARRHGAHGLSLHRRACGKHHLF